MNSKYRVLAIIIEASLHLLCQLPVTSTSKPAESSRSDRASEESLDRTASSVKCPNYRRGNYSCDSCLPDPGGCYCSENMLFQCKKCHDICEDADIMGTSSECKKYCPCYPSKKQLSKCSEDRKELYERLQNASQEIEKLKDELEEIRAKDLEATTSTTSNRMNEDKLKDAIETADTLLKVWIPVALVGSCLITAICFLCLLRRKLGSNDIVRLKAGFGDTSSEGSCSSVVDHCPKNVWNSVGNSGGQFPTVVNYYNKNTNNNVGETLSRTSSSDLSTTEFPVAFNNKLTLPKSLAQNPYSVGPVSANSRSQSHQPGFDLTPPLNANATNQAAAQFQRQLLIQNNQQNLPRIQQRQSRPLQNVHHNQHQQQHQQHRNNQNQSPLLLGVDNWFNNSPLIATSAAFGRAGTFPGEDASVSTPPPLPPQNALHAFNGYGAGGNVGNRNVRLRRSSSCGMMEAIRDSNNRNNEMQLSLPNVDGVGIANGPVNPFRHNLYCSSDDSDISNNNTFNNQLYGLYNNLYNNHNVVFRIGGDVDDNQVENTEVAILPPSRKAMKKKGKVENDNDKNALFELSELKIVQPETSDDVDDEPSAESLTSSSAASPALSSTSPSAATEPSSTSLSAVSPASSSTSPSAATEPTVSLASSSTSSSSSAAPEPSPSSPLEASLASPSKPSSATSPASSSTSSSAASSTLYLTTMTTEGDDNSNSRNAKARSMPLLETRVLEGDEERSRSWTVNTATTTAKTTAMTTAMTTAASSLETKTTIRRRQSVAGVPKP